MQLGSLGAAGLQTARHAFTRSNLARNIHISARHTRSGAGRQFLQQSRHFLAKFVSHLTAPGVGHQAYPSYNQVLRSTIGHRSPFPARTLARQTFLPRAPAIPRFVTQVGLGTARQFSSARPVFQHLVQNTPIATRALCEADIDVKSHKKSSKKTQKRNKSSNVKKTSYQVKDIEAPTPLSKSAQFSEMEIYFPSLAPEVTTSLHIPLAPTPTERTPLSDLPTRAEGSFLPVASLLSIHTSHELHTTRVASLFARLDAANVWDKGVTCSAYSHLAHGQGVATILKVEFVGWTKAEVRAVIGESGTGWCALEEHRSAPLMPDDSVMNGNLGDDSDMSDTSSILSGIAGDETCFSRTSTPPIDPSASFVLPTLDFSSSFLEAVQSAPSTPPILSGPTSDCSDFEYLSDTSGGSLVEILPSMGFSAEFLRINERSIQSMNTDPMEAMF